MLRLTMMNLISQGSSCIIHHLYGVLRKNEMDQPSTDNSTLAPKTKLRILSYALLVAYRHWRLRRPGHLSVKYRAHDFLGSQ